MMPRRFMTRSASPWPSRVFSSEYVGEVMPATGRSGAGKTSAPGLSCASADAKPVRKSTKADARHLSMALPPCSPVEWMAPLGRSGGQDPQGREARRPPHRVAREVRAGDTPEDHQGPGPNDAQSVLWRADQMIEGERASHSRPAPASGVDSQGTASEATVALRRGPPNDACCIWT